MKTNLKALSEEELKTFVENLGQSPYRAQQIINWIYKKRATSFEEMTNLSKHLRAQLNKKAFVSTLRVLKEQRSQDGTRKFLFELEDGKTTESVLIPDQNRLTLCISSQVGCAMGCKFCVTGTLKLIRNLKAYEIVDQIISAQRIINTDTSYTLPSSSNKTKPQKNQKITNIVLMGMGEPLHNFSEVIESLWRMVNLLGFSKRKITLSTAGIVPKISELAKKGPRINLALSLNASTDKIRNMIMPLNQVYPIKKLINACKKFPLEPRRKITFEYVLLDGINSSKEDAVRLVDLLKGIQAKVNLIPFNLFSQKLQKSVIPLRSDRLRPCFKKMILKTPSEDKTLGFQKILLNAGITAIIRKSKGGDISAACGQLKAGYVSSNS
jgi:23S rRNA (adenine2503-C2)-methyltransferase